MPGLLSSSSKVIMMIVVVAVLLVGVATPVRGKGHTSECNWHYYAIGFWYDPINLNNQTLGVSGKITVYDNKIKGTGRWIVEFVQILFYDGSWLQIGYEKNREGTGELKYYWEYCIYVLSPPLTKVFLKKQRPAQFQSLKYTDQALQTVDGCGSFLKTVF
ncbi:MAG: hypothetical protein QXI11_04535 [Thermoproteota archaeon]